MTVGSGSEVPVVGRLFPLLARKLLMLDTIDPALFCGENGRPILGMAN